MREVCYSSQRNPRAPQTSDRNKTEDMTPKPRKKRRRRNVPQRMTTESLFELFETRKEFMETSLDITFDDGFVDEFDDVFDEQKSEFSDCVRVSPVSPYTYRPDIADAVLNNKPMPSPRCHNHNHKDSRGTLDIGTDSSMEEATRKDEIDPSLDLKQSDTKCDKATQATAVKRTAVIVKRDSGPRADDFEVLRRTSTFSCHDNALFAAGYRPQRARSAGNSAVVKWLKEQDPTEMNLLPGNKKILNSLRETSSPIQNKMPPDESQRNDMKTRRLYDKVSRYLTLVYDYPKGFRKLRFLAASDPNMAPCVRRVMLMGQAFGDDFGPRESPVVLAANDLGTRRRLDSRVASVPPKETPLTSQPTSAKAHRLTVKSANPRERSRSPDCEYREPFEKNLLAQHGPVVAGLWKAREDAEKALASVSTCDGMRARDWVLRELGEGEGSVQQWWVSQRHCRYLRRRSSTDPYDWQDATS